MSQTPEVHEITTLPKKSFFANTKVAAAVLLAGAVVAVVAVAKMKKSSDGENDSESATEN